MKSISKFIITVSLLTSVSAQANEFGEGLAIGMIGSAILGGILQPRVMVAPSVGYPAAPYYPPTYSYGYSYRPMYRDTDIFDQYCQCWRTIRVQIN